MCVVAERNTMKREIDVLEDKVKKKKKKNEKNRDERVRLRW